MKKKIGKEKEEELYPCSELHTEKKGEREHTYWRNERKRFVKSVNWNWLLGGLTLD